MPSKTDINPKTGLAYAVNPQTRQWDDNYWSNVVEPNLRSANPLDAVNRTIQTAVDAYSKQFDEYTKKGKEFDTSNPFVYDDVLANQKTVAKQELDPYYQQTLGDFLTGIQTQRTRSVEDQHNLLDQLGANEDTFNRNQQQNETQSIEQANNQAADNGLYGSGQQLRTTGQIQANTNQNVGDYAANAQRQRNQSDLTVGRTAQDLALQESQRRRDLNQEEQYNINNQALGETGNLQNQHEFNRQQYVGAIPGSNPLLSDVNTYKLLGA